MKKIFDDSSEMVLPLRKCYGFKKMLSDLHEMYWIRYMYYKFGGCNINELYFMHACGLS